MYAEKKLTILHLDNCPYCHKARRALDGRLWEGCYTPTYPDGKRRHRSVYAHSEDECEAKLARLIAEMKAEIAALQAKERWQCVSC